MSKYGFNPKELRKTIVTQIDKDGFNNRTVVYGKDSGESGSSDFSRATITIHNESRFNFYYCHPRIIEDKNDESFGFIPYLDVSKLGPFNSNSSVSFETVLYKNMLKLPFDVMFSFADGLTSIATFYSACTVLVSGKVKVVEDDDYNYFRITGDCEITIKNTVDGPV